MVCGAEEALAQAQLVCTCTNAATPVLWGAALPRGGCHISAVGSYQPHTQEVDEACVAAAAAPGACCCVDSAEALDCGDMAAPLRAGLLAPQDVVLVSQLLGPEGGAFRRGGGRVAPGATTLFKSVGVAVQDVVTAAVVLVEAERLGLGRLVPL